MTERLLALVTALLLSLGAVAGEPPPRLEWTPCWFGVEPGRRADCGRLHVPQSRDGPAHGEVLLPLVVYRSGAAPSLPDPVVVLGGGGPGNAVGIAGEQAGDWWAFLDLLALEAGRDVVVMDQRGAGIAQPSLACERGEAEVARELARVQPLRVRLRELSAALATCRARLTADGVDLSAYDARAAAADVEALRRALGAPRLNLYGTSYGARIALALMRQHPQSVRSAILDSPVTPEARFYEEAPDAAVRGFSALFAACESDPACAGFFPDTALVFERLLRRLDRRPLVLTVAWPGSLAPFSLQVDSERLLEMLFNALYDHQRAARLPLVIHALDRGSSDLLAPLARDLVKQYLSEGWNEGLYYAAMCREEMPFNDLDGALASAERTPGYESFNRHWILVERAACEAWRVPPASREVEAPVGGDVPVLALAGRLDPVTPPQWARAAAERLPRAWFQEFAGVGHDVIGSSDCALQMAAAFLRQPTEDPRRQGCSADDPPWFDLDF